MQTRKQADQSQPGDCVGVSLSFYFEISRIERQGDGQVLLEVIPANCDHENCPDGCDCHYSLFDNHAGPFKLRMDGKRRLLFAGNLEQDEAQVRLLAARVKRRRASRNGRLQGEEQPEPQIEHSS